MKTRLHTADVLTFTLTGAEPQRALTLAALHDIRLFHIRALPSGVQAQIAGVDWPRLQALLGDDRWTVKLLRCRGPGGFLEQLALRPGLPLGAAWAFLVTLLLSRFVWTIDFEPLDADTQASLRQLLAGQDICEGTLLTKDALAQVQALALQQSDRFGWISLNFTGGRLFVESTEAEHQTIEAPPTQTALYAAAAGEVTAIEAESGFCAVTVGQQVQAGDLLVDVQRLDRKGNPVLQGASGRVLARVEKSYSAAQPYYPTQLTLTRAQCCRGKLAAAGTGALPDGGARRLHRHHRDRLPAAAHRPRHAAGRYPAHKHLGNCRHALPLQRVHRPSTGPAGLPGTAVQGVPGRYHRSRTPRYRPRRGCRGLHCDLHFLRKYRRKAVKYTTFSLLL